jgi:putative nucleotidyltransferase with HDIG domain
VDSYSWLLVFHGIILYSGEDMDTIEIDVEKYDLKALLDAKYPFLERFRERAAGTFQHCQNVADLCEAVALELGLNTDVARILGMYHDAGKITFPKAFYENQNGTNIHDELDPLISFQIISKHVADTALILIQLQDFPKELIPPITQHHGTTVLKSLFKKSHHKNDSDFRYKNTSPPESLEAIMLMICDSVDATLRSIEHSGDKIDIDKIVYDTIERYELDGQIDELKIGHSKKIKHALITTLKAKYHSRSNEDYQDEEDDKTIGERKKK